MHIDKHIDTDSRSVDETRTAKVTKTENRGPIGVPVFFSAEELEGHGVDLAEFDEIAVHVEDGIIMFAPPGAVIDSE